MDKDGLLKEMLLSKEQGKWTGRGVEFISEVVDMSMERFVKPFNPSEEDFEDIRNYAIMHCYDNGLRFKPEKLTDGFSYLSIVARSSFASSVLRIKRAKGLIPPLPPGTVVVGPGEWAESTPDGIKKYKLN